MSLGALGLLRWLLPEALRSLFLVCLGLQLFSWSALWLPRQGIELAALLGATSSDNYKLAADFRRFSRISWLGYWILFSMHLITPTSYLPPWTLTVLSWTLICGLITLPTSWWLGHQGQLSLSASLGRCLWPFDWRTPTCFVDVLTGDILTSYARVLAEWDGLVQLALFPGSSRTGEEVTPWSLSPSGLSLLLIWMRQCWADFNNSRRWRPLLNAIKYATAFPMILLSLVAPRGAPSWILASLSNALYSAGWDLYVDWELHGRRKYYMFPRWSYALAAILNASLRFTWILPLLEGPQAAGPTVDGLFTLQLLEILRRFLWVPFRVESQQVQGQSVVGSLAITSSDGLMIPLEGVKMLSP